MRVEFLIPGPVPSAGNLWENWRARAARNRKQREAGWAYAQKHDVWKIAPPLTITMTRVSPRKLDDDNLATACKSARDGVADALGIDDGDARLEWRYAQERGKAPGLRVTIESKGGPEEVRS